MLYFSCGAIFLAWLAPNHYFPWLSAWQDAISISGLLITAIYSIFITKKLIKISFQIFALFTLIFCLPWLQLAKNHLLFAGDAVMVSFYATLGLMAVYLGHWLFENKNTPPLEGMRVITSSCAFAAILSTGVALVQWTGAFPLGIYGAELPPGSRPFANVAQPNHLNTLCFLGICSIFWLYEQRKIGKTGFWLGALFLAIGMLLSQSRTGWLQIFLLIVWGSIQNLRMHNRISLCWLAMLGGIFGAGVLLWQPLNNFLLLTSGRDLTSQMHPGTRPAYWLSMWDALWREPWWGYGWQQVGAAQQNVAIDHPPSIEYFEHSHNMVLDFLLWNGIPIGIFLTALLVFWLYRQICSYTQTHTGWLLTALIGLSIHAMLEYPLEYAYFLIPAGLLIGCIEASTPQANIRLVTIPRKVFAGCLAAMTVVSILVAGEWLAAEANYRSLRFESARIGEQDMASEPPNFRLLTQLSAFLTFARTEATPDMSAEQVEWMHKVSMRFGYPPAMLRYALAAGLNGRPREAEITLQRICHIHGPQRCTEAQEGWQLLQQQFPQLQQIPGPQQITPSSPYRSARPPTSLPASPAP